MIFNYSASYPGYILSPCLFRYPRVITIQVRILEELCIQFLRTLRSIAGEILSWLILTLRNFPCVVYIVVMNEDCR